MNLLKLMSWTLRQNQLFLISRIMKKQTILYMLLVFLLISNGFFLWHYLGKHDRRGGHKPESFITKKLNFDDKQMQEFKLLRDLHFDKIKSFSKEIRSLKKELFSKISDESINPAYLDSITSLIALQEKAKDVEVFNHLQKVRTLCNEEQTERFVKILNDAMERHGRRGRPRKKD